MSSSNFLSGLDLSHVPYSSPPPGEVSDFINPETLTCTAIAVSVTTLVLALTLLLLRLYSTIIVTRSIGSDDFTTIIAYIFSVVATAIMLNSSSFARHSWDFSLATYTPELAKLIFAESIIAPVALFFAKISILILFHRLFSLHKGFRYANYLGIAWAFLILIIFIIMSAVCCTPRHMESFSSVEVAMRCSDFEGPITVRGALIVALDFYIFLLPLPLLWKLQLTLRRKVELTIVFMTASIACIASVLGLAFQLELLRGDDKVWNGYRVEIAAVVETNVAIMVACMPSCAPLSKRIWHKLSDGTSVKAWFAKSRSSTDAPSPPGGKANISGAEAAASTEHKDDNANRRFWRPRVDLRYGETTRRMSLSMEELPSLNTDASVSEDKEPLDFYHASFDSGVQSVKPKEDV